MWKETIRFSIISLSGTAISRFFLLLLNVSIIRALNTEQYAAFALLSSILTWALVFSHFDVSAGISKYVSQSLAKCNLISTQNYYVNGLLIAICLSIFGIAFGLLFSFSCFPSQVTKLAFFFSLLPWTMITINDGLIKGHVKFTYSAVLDASTGFSRFAVFYLYLFCSSTPALEHLLTLHTGSFLFPMLLSFAFVFSLSPKVTITAARIDRTTIITLLSYSKWVCLTDLLNSGIFLFCSFLLSFFAYEDLAKFNVSVLIYSIIQIALAAITAALVPQVSRKAALKQHIPLPTLKQLCYFLLLTLVFICLVFCVPHKASLMRFVFNTDLYEDSLNYAVLLALTIPFRTYSMIYKGIVQGLGNSRAIALVAFKTFVANLSISTVCYWFFGLQGLVFSLNVCVLIEFVLSHRVISRLR